MEVKPGYKLTEVGVIPEDWEVAHFSGLFEITAGGDFDPSQSSDLQDDNHPYPIYSNAVSDAGLYGYCSYNGHHSGSISVTARGTLGIANYRDHDFNAIGRVLVLKPIDELDGRFFSEYINNRIIFVVESTGVPQLTAPQIAKINVVVPPLPEQTAIATTLSDVDALISSLDALISKKKQIKQGAMQELLSGKRRLPGFSGEWEVKRLGDCLTSRPDYGINAPAVPYSDGLPTYIRITDISDDGRFTPESLVSVAHPDAEHYYLNEGDLVFARTGASVGKSYLYNTRDAQLVFAGFLIRIHPDLSKLIPAFLANFVQTSRYWTWVKLMSMRSGQPGINGNEYAQLPIPCPTVEEQTAVATILSDMDAEVFALEEKLAKARTIKQGLMQELLTGKIRLIEPRHGLGRDTC